MFLKFEIDGEQCAAWQSEESHTNHWCGYVLVPNGHPWHGKDWNGIDARVHGGITFARGGQSKSCPSEFGPGWWIGFDCNHAWDLPFPNGDKRNDGRVIWFDIKAKYRDLDYVKSELASLVQQMKDAKK